MTETTSTKPSFVSKAVVTWKKHERKILIGTTVVSTAAALAMRSGIAQHNAFLKEHGLYEAFYALESTPTPEA